MKKLIWIFVFVLIIGQGVFAEPKDPNELLLAKWQAPIKDANDPNELLHVKWDAVVNVLQQQDMDPNTKADIIDVIVSPMFDFPMMSKLALGKANWSKLSAEQAKRFSRLFVEHLKKTYREKISLYEDQKSSFGQLVEKGKTVHIPMRLVNGESDVTILYKLHRPEKQWKIYDVEIQGVSIILTYRSQFNDILSHGTIEDVLSHLKKPVKP